MDDQFKRLVAVFGMPNRPDPKAFIDEFVKAVGTVWPDGVLERSVSRLIREHEEPFWPTPGKLRAICMAECPRPIPTNDLDDGRPALTDEQLAEQERVMREHRQRMIAQKLDDDAWGNLPDVSRDACEEMQRRSPNINLHRRAGHG